MLGLLKKKINLGFIVNPFYLYCVSFSLAIFVYLWGWSRIFPKLSFCLFLFFVFSFALFLFTGSILGKKENIRLNIRNYYPYLNDIMFYLIIFLGIINVLKMGYLPVLVRSHDYREFGVPVLDPLFNSLSIFFSIFFFQIFLEFKKKRFLIFVIIILIFQILIFRRSTVLWIVTSSSFLYLLYNQKIKLIVIIAGILSLPLLSYCFGLYGNTRSNLTKSFVMNDLGASDHFKSSGISHNHYMTYLYVASPLANLQKNIDEGNGFFNNRDFKDFFFYCLLPESFTLRLEKKLNLKHPDCNLITPNLIVGSFLMVSFYTIGWLGMIIMLLFLLIFIFVSLFLIRKFNTFSITTFCILSTAVSLLIFSNFLNRLDVILMLFIYPVLFHFIFTRSRSKVIS